MPTFSVIKTTLLREFLLGLGWTESPPARADFSYIDEPLGTVRRLASKDVVKYSWKRGFYRLLEHWHYTSCTPATYLKLSDVPPSDRIYFVKPSKGYFSHDIKVCHTYAELARTVKHLPANSYVIQENVHNPDLWLACKYTCRVHLLLDNRGRGFVYDKVCATVSKAMYQADSNDMAVHLPDKKVHVLITDPRKLTALTQLCRDLSRIYQRTLSFGDASFHLLGLDVIFDRNNKPWVVEINSKPSLMLYYSEVRNRALYQLVSDFYHLVIAPRVLGQPERQGGFIKCYG